MYALAGIFYFYTNQKNMNNGFVKSSIEKGIARVTFHHPQSNSLPGEILRALAAEIEKIGHEPEARVIILQSEGEKAFCA